MAEFTGSLIFPEARDKVDQDLFQVIQGLATRLETVFNGGIELGVDTNKTMAQLSISDFLKIAADNKVLSLGAGDDAGIWYDGTNLHIDAQLVGSGVIILDNVPTSDPSIAGAIWSDSNVLTLSAG